MLRCVVAVTTPPNVSAMTIDKEGVVSCWMMTGRVFQREILPITLTPVSCWNTLTLISSASTVGVA